MLSKKWVAFLFILKTKKMKLKIDTKAPENINKNEIKEMLVSQTEKIGDLQEKLFAQNKKSVLIIFQGMDASGKDGLTKDIFPLVNPFGIKYTSFKAPTEIEKNHDFLWRIHQEVPEKGKIQVFNRSHYEDILITRVHNWIDDKKAQQRIEAINNFEKLLQENDTEILKFYLHISSKEQQERLLERKENPDKQYKSNEQDFVEATFWDTYMNYYEETFSLCNNPEWHIIPADQKWYRNYLTANVLIEKLKGMVLY